MLLWFFFFFQAEDGIRDGHVTGVQTCALPISAGDRSLRNACNQPSRVQEGLRRSDGTFRDGRREAGIAVPRPPYKALQLTVKGRAPTGRGGVWRRTWALRSATAAALAGS